MTRASWASFAKKTGSKYRNQPTEADGIKFSSKAEARYYLTLKTHQVMGIVSHFLRQVPFHLPGGVIYRLDFLVFYMDGTQRYVDVKGMETATFKLKKKQVEALYRVTIETEK